MAVLNVTPDSFSDGGRFVDVDDRRRPCPRPGGCGCRPDRRRWRVHPTRCATDLRGRGAGPGAAGGRAAGRPRRGRQHRHDARRGRRGRGRRRRRPGQRRLGWPGRPGMHAWIAGVEVPYVAMHWRGHSTDMERLATYDDVVGEVRGELADRLAELAAAGVDPARVVVDPGLGFAKDAAHNWALLPPARAGGTGPSGADRRQSQAIPRRAARPARAPAARRGPRRRHRRHHGAGGRGRRVGGAGPRRARLTGRDRRRRGVARGRAPGPDGPTRNGAVPRNPGGRHDRTFSRDLDRIILTGRARPRFPRGVRP